MAYDDLPIVDRYSINEDKSDIKLREHLNQTNNFICRKDVPDKGCDFDVELIENDRALNSRFPIQLKSVEKLKLINNNELISYSFETSRLGYLLRRPISGGLIILYSLEKDKCFYEYADKIYTRLIEERNNEEWKKNDSVNIHIPLTNVLDESSAKEIYELFNRRFEQGAKMQNTHGIKYGLPVIVEKDFKYDFSEITHIKKFLKEYGYLFLNNYEFDLLYQALIRLPSLEINSDKELSILAIVAYSEAAQYAESELYINRVKRKYDLIEFESGIVTFQSLKNKLLLGYIDNAEFINKLNEIEIQNENSASTISIKINILRYKILEAKAFDALSHEFRIECKKIFDLIETCECPEKFKNLFKIWISEIESMIILDILRTDLAAVMLKESLGTIIPVSDKLNKISAFISSQIELLNRFNDIYKLALEQNDKVLQGNALAAYITHFIQKEIILISTAIDFTKPVGEEREDELKKYFGFAIQAYNCFVEANMFKEAHYNLCNALEILFESEMLFNSDVKMDKENLLALKENLEKGSDIIPYEFQLPKLIKRIKENIIRKYDSNMAFTNEMTDSQLFYVANIALESYSLPSERLENIINELKAYRMFNQRCKDDNIQVLQAKEFANSKSDYYKYPVQFVLRSKVTGIETTKNSNMDELLKSWNF